MLWGWRTFATAVAILAFLPVAHAHQVFVHATAEGAVITGEALTLPSDPVRSARVRVLGPDGETLGETTTGADGAFTFTATKRCDHRLVVTAPDGHRATFTVPASELPDHLPTPGAGSAPGAAPAEGAPGNLDRVVEEAVGRAVAPLRRDLARFQERARLQDLIAGFGYIAGLVGLALWVKTRRRPG